MGIKIKGKILGVKRVKKFFIDFPLHIRNFIYFLIFLTFLSQNSDSQTQNYIPHHYKSTPIALCNCDDSQLRVRNVEKI